jgi:hypothetical protein
MIIGGKAYTRAQVLERVGQIRQLGGTRHIVLDEGRAKGVSAIDVNTGSGFQFSVLPDRGLDIFAATYKGENLVFQTPNGVSHPAYYEPLGSGWLRSFFGGLLTTCGLTYLGPPGRDGSHDLGLHGRYSTTPACQVNDRSQWKGDEYCIEVCGVIEESALFTEKVRLTRTIKTQIGAKFLTLRDVVENFGYQPTPFTILYHINPGFPLLDKGSELFITSANSKAYDDSSAEHIDDIWSFSEPLSGFGEQNYLHTMLADDQGLGHVAHVNRELNGGLGMYVSFDVAMLPYLSEWKMMGQGEYVLGIEPANVPCLNRSELRKRGELPMLAAGEIKEMHLEIGVLDGNDEIKEYINKIEGKRVF